jgi:hypothetical protein
MTTKSARGKRCRLGDRQPAAVASPDWLIQQMRAAPRFERIRPLVVRSRQFRTAGDLQRSGIADPVTRTDSRGKRIKYSDSQCLQGPENTGT